MSYGYPSTGAGFPPIRPASSLAGTGANPFAPSSFPTPPSSFPSGGFPSSYSRPPEPAPTGFPAYSGSSFAPSSYSAARPPTGYPSSYSTSAFPAASTSPFQSAGFPPASTAYPSSSSSAYPPAQSFPSASNGTVGTRYQAGEEKEGYTSMAIMHIGSMTNYANKSTEELRMEDYQHNRARGKIANTAPPYTAPAANPFAGSSYSSYSSYRQPTAQPGTSVFSPTPTTSSFFNNPAPAPPPAFQAFPTSQPTTGQNPFATNASVFSQNALTPQRNSYYPAYAPTAQFPNTVNPPAAPAQPVFPSFVPPAASTSNPFAGAASAFTPQPSSTAVGPSTSQFFAQPVQQYSNLNSYSMQRPTTPQTYSFTPQPVTMSMSTSASDAHTMVQAYRDPVGLSWLFPNGVPEELLQNRQTRSALAKPTSTVEQILRNKSPVAANFSAFNMTERWRRNKERHGFSPVRSRTEARISPIRNEASVFSKKDFTGLKLDPRPDENSMLQLSPQRNSIQVQVRAYNPDLVQRTVTVERKGRVADLADQVALFVRPKADERVELVYRGRRLKADEPLSSVGLTPTEEVTVLLELQQTRVEPVNLTALPRLTKEGYNTSPSLSVLSRMSPAELQRVRDFTIRNEHGEVVFEDDTDVTELDLDVIVEIEPKAVVLYPDGKGLVKPLVGKGLNKAALVRLFNCIPKKETSAGEFERKIRKVCERNGSQFVSYDGSTGEWVFRVPHF